MHVVQTVAKFYTMNIFQYHAIESRGSSIQQTTKFPAVGYETNLCRVLFAIATNVSITGTSTNTPTTVTSVAPESNPNRTIATATESSKKLLAPIIAAGAAIL